MPGDEGRYAQNIEVVTVQLAWGCGLLLVLQGIGEEDICKSS